MNDPQTPTLFDAFPDADEGRETAATEAPRAAPETGQKIVSDDLNPAQLQAVTHSGGHCLVLAGAGSGKTRVLTHRIAWLVAEKGIHPREICAVTFTNKAAAEMRGRVRRLLGSAGGHVWLSTFHSLGLRLLREWSEAREPIAAPTADSAHSAAWLPPRGFAVYNRDASLAVWKRCQSALRVSARDHDPGRLFGRCSSAVSRLEDPASWDADNQSWERKVAGRVWKSYRAAMRAAGAVDFDDLLVLPLHLLSADAGLRNETANRFRQLLIDEYQDTNRIQYRLVQSLLGSESELLVVGDEDQSIYRWRGADLNNVLDFQTDFPGATVVRLEQNYRSTQPILSAAGSLVANNRQRLGKSLWTDHEGGEPPTFVQCATDREEAEWVANKIGELTAASGEDPVADLSDIAVLYRTNAQSRQLEEIFIGRRIPHRVVGGQRFFARREVRDILAYLQLLARDDTVALHRAISVPSRGIGPKTLEALAAVDPAGGPAAALRHLSLQPDPGRAFAESGFSPAITERLTAFGSLIAALREVAAASSVAELIRVTIERSGYAALLEREDNSDDRLGNLGELIAAAKELAAESDENASSLAADTGTLDLQSSDPRPREDGLAELRTFLDRLALLADADTNRDDAAGVRLMTVHAAKGLEFRVVFLAGMEEELFPHATSIAEGDVEEERRLCYVGMTRARQRLFMSAARSRRLNGRERWQEPSRFVSEIDPRHIVLRDYLSPRSVGSKGYASSSFSGLGGRTGQRSRGRGGSPRRSWARKGASPPARSAPKVSGPTRAATVDDLTDGAVVVHAMFGPGRIVTAAGSGDKLKLEIKFNKSGTKNVIAKFAKLEVPV